MNNQLQFNNVKELSDYLDTLEGRNEIWASLQSKH